MFFVDYFENRRMRLHNEGHALDNYGFKPLQCDEYEFHGILKRRS